MRYSKDGFSLIEILIVSGILIVAISGLLYAFSYSSTLTELAGSLTFAVSEAQDKLEEIRDHDFALITTDYVNGGTPGDKFNLSGLQGKGVIYIDSSNSKLIEVKVVVSWITEKGRVVGEDTNLDGTLDAGEDKNSNGKLDSPASIMSLIAKR